jgi:hypothetical protein
MPRNPFLNNVLDIDQEDLQANEHAQLGVQANETFVLHADDGAALGLGGEQVAFAKKEFGSSRPQLKADMERDANLIKVVKDLENKVRAGQTGVAQAQKDLARDQGLLDRLGERTEANAANYDALAKDVQDGQAKIAALQNQAEEAAFVLAELRAGRMAGEQMEGLDREVVQAMNTQKAWDADMKLAKETGGLYNSAEYETNPDLGGDRNLLTRAVASTAVDRLLDTHVLAEEKFGMDGQGNVLGVSVQADGVGVKGDYRADDGIKRECYLDAQYDNAKIQKGLSDLEVVDYITGQVDRHCGNIFVEPGSGKVTGIDNDMAFPEKDRSLMAAEREFKGTESLPRIIDRSTADKIMAVKPEELRETLKGVTKPRTGETLSDAEIEGAVQRLEQLQAAIRDPESVQRPAWESRPNPDLSADDKARLAELPPFQVVDQFTPDTYAEAMDYQNLRFKAATGTTIGESNNPTDLGTFNRTSYLGAIEAQKRQITVNAATMGDQFGVRPPGTAQAAARNVAEGTYNKVAAERFDTLLKQARQGLKDDPSQIGHTAQAQQVRQLNGDIAALEKKLAEYEKREQKPTLGDRLRGLRGDGIQEELQKKKEAALESLKEKQAELDKVLDKAVEPMVSSIIDAARHEGDLARNAVIAQEMPTATESVRDTLKRTQAGKVSHHDADLPGPRAGQGAAARRGGPSAG